MEAPPNKETASAPVSVFWDMKRCPVPDGYDARRVGPCIKRILRKLGYSGPITITAVGSLAKVPRDILEAVTSTGIYLKHGPYSYKNMVSLFVSSYFVTPRPATMMVISRPADYTPPKFSSLLSTLLQSGLNCIFPYPYDTPLESSSTHTKCLWKNFLLSGPLEGEDSCSSETGELALWVCTVCRNIGEPCLLGQGVGNFIWHLSSRQHEVMLPGWFTPSGPSDFDGESEEFEDEEAL